MSQLNIGLAVIGFVVVAFFARSQDMDPLVWHIASAVIFASILAHGVTAAAFTRLYARRMRTKPDVVKSDLAIESTEA